MHRPALARTKRRTRRARRTCALHGRTALKNRLAGNRTSRSGAHCATNRNSGLYRRRRRSWPHRRFVHRSRPSLGNDHARRRWWRSNWPRRNRRRWRSTRGSHWCGWRRHRGNRRSHRPRRRSNNSRRRWRRRYNGWRRQQADCAIGGAAGTVADGGGGGVTAGAFTTGGATVVG